MLKVIRLMAAATFTALSVAAAAEMQKPAPPAAQDFAVMAAQSDEYEIQAGRTAETQTADPRVRAFARQMIDDHTKISDDLRRAAVASGLEAPPSAMSSDQAMFLGALQSLRGVEFDRSYLRQQALAHHQALAVVHTYAQSGTDAQLRLAAQTAEPTIRHHLQMAETLRDELGGS